jgi:hypothetical protein
MTVKQKRARAPLSKEAALLYGQSLGLSVEQVEDFYDHHAAAGWMLTRGRRMVDGEAALRTWARHARQYAAERESVPERLGRVTDRELRVRREKVIDGLNEIFHAYGKNPQGAVGDKKRKLQEQRAAIVAEQDKRNERKRWNV